MTPMTKITVSKAEVGDQFSIRRGRCRECLGSLLTKLPSFNSHGKRNGWMVTFGDGGEVTYSGFAGGATVLLRHDYLRHQEG